VPDNQDPALVVEDADPAFWDRVRLWQADGWAIGLHGYQHRYVTQDRGLVGLRAKSEFAGLTAQAQAAKLDASLAVFQAQQVRVDAWVAPGHTFDATTVALLHERGVDVVSDGFARRAARDAAGVVWVPQQLWRFRERRSGEWTVCLHVNAWTDAQQEQFAVDLRRYADRLVPLSELVDRGRRRRVGVLDRATAKAGAASVQQRARVAARLRR